MVFLPYVVSGYESLLSPTTMRILMFLMHVLACKILFTKWRLVGEEDMGVTLHTKIKPGPLHTF